MDSDPDRVMCVPTVYTVPTGYSMTMEGLPRMGIRDLRKDIGRCVDEAHYLKKPTVITKNGVDLAFIGPYEWLDERDELEAYRAKYGPLEK